MRTESATATHSSRSSRTLLSLALAATLLTACGENDPMSPTVEGPQETSDYPTVPKPTSPGAEAPMESETLTFVARNRGDFVGRATSGIASWEVHHNHENIKCLAPVGDDVGPQETFKHRNVHSSELTLHGRSIAYAVRPWKMTLQKNGRFVDPQQVPGTIELGHGDVFGGRQWGSWLDHSHNLNTVGREYTYRNYYIIDAPRISETVYLKRERFWRRVPVDGRGAMFAQLTGETQFTIETQYKEGLSIERSRTFAETVDVGANGGVGYSGTGVLASVNYAVTNTFGTTKGISKEKTVSVTQTVSGIRGKTVIFMLWELVERYSICDANGDPYTDPSFEFDPDFGTVEIQGRAISLEATEFDAN